jgi:16S rRNA (guanine966-N2)-methyltransferase
MNPSTKNSQHPTGQVRIIGGQWRSRRLPVFMADGLRPSSDRVRETVFNWLNHLWGGVWGDKAILDAFAGSGALGLEAASRGAHSVHLVEKSPAIASQLKTNIHTLQASQCHVHAQDALVALPQLTANSFDLIFCDPPFHQNLLPKILPLVTDLLKNDGLLYIESEQNVTLPESSWLLLREGKTAQVRFHVYQKVA